MNTTAETTGAEPRPTAPPLIVWTLQRTGGRHLTQQLLAACGLAAAEHEPFKVGAVFGRVTADWVQNKDEPRLREAIRAICERRINIQHDIEGMPWEISRSLLEACCAAGYSHLFLYRQRALDRLLSLHFTRENAMWEPDSSTNAAVRNYVFAQPLPVAKLVLHERYCVDLMGRLWALALQLGATPMALAFEQVFHSDQASAQARLLSTLKTLGLSRGATADAPAVQRLLDTIRPTDPNRYHRFAGAKKLEAALPGVPRFEATGPAPDRATASERFQVTRLSQGHPWIAYAVIDAVPTVFVDALPVKIGGLVVLNPSAPRHARLVVEIAGQTSTVAWSNASPKMKQQFPDSPNSSHARFQINRTLADGDARLLLQSAEPGEPDLPLFAIRLAPASS